MFLTTPPWFIAILLPTMNTKKKVNKIHGGSVQKYHDTLHGNPVAWPVAWSPRLHRRGGQRPGHGCLSWMIAGFGDGSMVGISGFFFTPRNTPFISGLLTSWDHPSWRFGESIIYQFPFFFWVRFVGEPAFKIFQGVGSMVRIDGL